MKLTAHYIKSCHYTCLQKLSHTVPPRSLLAVYNSNFQCHNDYCLSIWGHTTQENIPKHTQFPNWAAGIICTDFDYNHSALTFVQRLGLLAVLDLRDYLILITVSKCLNDLALHYLPDLFVYVSDVHNRITRQNNIGDLFVFNATTTYMQKSLQYSGSLLWIRLPQHIRNATT